MVGFLNCSLHQEQYQQTGKADFSAFMKTHPETISQTFGDEATSEGQMVKAMVQPSAIIMAIGALANERKHKKTETKRTLKQGCKFLGVRFLDMGWNWDVGNESAENSKTIHDRLITAIKLG